MADGDAVLRDIQAAVYHADTGKLYINKTPSYQVAQGLLGWVAATDAQIIANDSAPRGLKKRRWLVWNPADHTQRASVNVATNAAYIAAVPGTTTVLLDYRGYELTMTVYALEGERRRGKIADNAVQASLPPS